MTEAETDLPWDDDWPERIEPPADEIYGDYDDEPEGPRVVPEPEGAPSQEAAVVASRRLPEAFWEARKLFAIIRQAAWATQTHPDAVLGCVLARAAGAVSHHIKFDSGRGGPTGSLNLFVCLLAPSGIGKSEAARAASALVLAPRQHLGPNGVVDLDRFRDGVGIGTGEGLSEVYMGTVERETGEIHKSGKYKGDPIVERVRGQVRHNVFFYVDEGETLTKLMSDRQGATLGPALRTSWSGGTLGQTNAKEETTRYVPAGSYSMGIVIGYQPETAVAVLSDIGPGTPQRFLWLGAQDTEMPAEDYEFPDRITLPPPDLPTGGTIHFPIELKRALKAHNRAKHHGDVTVAPLDSHEPLMRCKLAALLALLDGRMEVNREDWQLGGMIWATSTAHRDGLLAFRQQTETDQRERKRAAREEEAETTVRATLRVTGEITRAATRLALQVHRGWSERGEATKRYLQKKDFGRDKRIYDDALVYAKAQGWILSDDEDALLTPGPSLPASS